MAMVQGVRQVPPSDGRASALAGFDWISSTEVVGFGFNESRPGMELQAAIRATGQGKTDSWYNKGGACS
jgi:hypothetical protein